MLEEKSSRLQIAPPWSSQTAKDGTHLGSCAARQSGSQEPTATAQLTTDKPECFELSQELSTLRDNIPSLRGRTTIKQERGDSEYLQVETGTTSEGLVSLGIFSLTLLMADDTAGEHFGRSDQVYFTVRGDKSGPVK